MFIRSITFALMSKQSAFDYKILQVTFFPKAYLSTSTLQPLTKTTQALLKRLVMSDVVIVIDEIKDYLLQFGRLHLSVSDTDSAVGNVPLYHGLQLKQIGNTVIHEEYLPVTAHLEIDGVGNDFLVEGVHFRLDGIAVRRRG